MGAYRKFLMAAAGAVMVVIAASTSDNVFTTAEIAQAILAGLAPFGVYVLPNAVGYRFIKSLVAGASAGFGLLAGWLAAGDTITTSMWVNLAIAVATALGVFIVPNDPEPVSA